MIPAPLPAVIPPPIQAPIPAVIPAPRRASSHASPVTVTVFDFAPVTQNSDGHPSLFRHFKCVVTVVTDNIYIYTLRVRLSSLYVYISYLKNASDSSDLVTARSNFRWLNELRVTVSVPDFAMASAGRTVTKPQK